MNHLFSFQEASSSAKPSQAKQATWLTFPDTCQQVRCQKCETFIMSRYLHKLYLARTFCCAELHHYANVAACSSTFALHVEFPHSAML